MTYTMKLIQLARAIDALLRESIDASQKILQNPKQSLLSKLFKKARTPNYKIAQDMCIIITNDLDKIYIELSVIDVLGTQQEKVISETFKNYINPLRSSVGCLLQLTYLLEDYKTQKQPLDIEACSYYIDLYEKYDIKRARFGASMNESFQWLMTQKEQDVI